MKLFNYTPNQEALSSRERSYLWLLEFLWWVSSLIFVIIIMVPIYRGVDYYPFMAVNIGFILLFFHYSRNVVFLRYSILRIGFWRKFFLALITIPVLFLMAGQFGYFQTFMDEHTMGKMMPDMTHDNQVSLNKYIKTQMIFFASGTFIGGTLFVFRMMLSLWRLVNKKGF